MTTIGAYELLEELGRGGQGVVHRARHLPTGGLRAVKVLTAAADPETLARFRRESEALARVGSGAVPVHESGVERGRPYFVMGLMTGGSLRARLRAERRLDPDEAIALVATLARTLQRFHEAGFVHRDLKPDNVLFDDEKRPHISDFGCVRDLGSSLTQTGAVIGTPAYMAPEQLDGRPVDARADLFALGVVLHELVSGELPFPPTSSPFQELQNRMQGRRAPIPGSASAPKGLDRVLDRCLAPDVTARHRTAAALADDLERLAKGLAPGRSIPFALLVAGVAVLVAIAIVVAAGVARLAAEPKTPPELPAPLPRPSPPPPPPPPPAPVPAAVWLARATSKARQGDLEQARADLAKAFEIGGHLPSILEEGARVQWHSLHHPWSALASVNSAIALEKTTARFKLKIELELILLDREAALADLQTAAELDASFETLGWINKMRLQATQMPRPTEDVQRTAAQRYEAFVRAIDAANEAQHAEDFASARRHAEEAMALYPEDVWARYVRAEALRATGARAEADRDCEWILERSPRHGGALQRRAEARSAKGDHAAALADADVVVEVAGGTESWPYEGRSRLRRAAGMLDAAIADLGSAVALAKRASHRAEYLLRRAEVELEKGDPAAADADVERALAERSDLETAPLRGAPVAATLVHALDMARRDPAKVPILVERALAAGGPKPWIQVAVEYIEARSKSRR